MAAATAPCRPFNKKRGENAAMAYETVLYDVQDQILTITLNRPEKLNAFTPGMVPELIDCFDRADADDNVRAIIVTGAGRAFCAGADISQGFDRVGARTGCADCAPTASRTGATTPCATAAGG